MFDFIKCMDDVFGAEGGVSDNPNDLGGHTAYGMTQHTYNQSRINRHLPIQDVTLATRVELIQIYREEFWIKSGCDKLLNINKDRLALLHFHVTVQRGPFNAVCMLQTTLNVNPPTGFFGNITLNLVSLALEDSLIYLYLSKMKAHYLEQIVKVPSQSVFKKGWLNRLNKIATTINSSWHIDINAEN